MSNSLDRNERTEQSVQKVTETKSILIHVLWFLIAAMAGIGTWTAFYGVDDKLRADRDAARSESIRTEAALKQCQSSLMRGSSSNASANASSIIQAISPEALALLLLMKQLEAEQLKAGQSGATPATKGTGDGGNVLDSVYRMVQALVNLGALAGSEAKSLLDELKSEGIRLGKDISLELAKGIIERYLKRAEQKPAGAGGTSSMHIAAETGITINLSCPAPPPRSAVRARSAPQCPCEPNKTAVCTCPTGQMSK